MKLNKLILTIVIAFWSLVIGIGTVWMTDYNSRPGRAAVSPAILPDDDLKQFEYLPKVLVFLHPQCPCSRATLAELARLNTRNAGLADVHIFFYQPSDQADEWSKTDLWRQAAAIPNVSVDIIGKEKLQKFGAITSGQILLYDTQKRLVFSGGITDGRGHEGDNDGRESIEKYLQTGETTVSQTPVFGCILTTSE